MEVMTVVELCDRVADVCGRWSWGWKEVRGKLIKTFLDPAHGVLRIELQDCEEQYERLRFNKAATCLVVLVGSANVVKPSDEHTPHLQLQKGRSSSAPA
jgi:hypothetical protein